MTKRRVTGRVNGDAYEVVSPEGHVLKSIPMPNAAGHSKLQAAIQRNGWEQI